MMEATWKAAARTVSPTVGKLRAMLTLMTAMDAAQAYYNTYDTIVEDYIYIGDDIYMEEYVNDSFSEEYMNDDMMMGLTGDGRVFFISELASFGGAPTYYEMYDQFGFNMYYENGWVQFEW